MEIYAKINTIIKNRTIKNGVLFSIFSFINKGFSFVLLMVIAGYITPIEYGYLSLFNTVLMVIGYFIALSTEGYLSIAYFKEGEEGIRQTMSVILFLGVFITFLFLVTGIIFGTKISIILNIPQRLLMLCVLICFFNLFNSTLLDLYRIKGKIKSYGILSCGNAFLNFVLSIVFIKYCLLSWQGRIYAQTFCTVFVGTYGLLYFLKKHFFSKDFRKSIQPMLVWSVPLIPHLATVFVRQGCDRYIINAYYEINEVGLFSFALTLTTIITMVGTGLNQSNSVDIYKMLGDSNLSCYKKLIEIKKKEKIFFTIYLFTTIITALLGICFIPFFFPNYMESRFYFLILSAYGFLMCVYLIYTNYLSYYNKTRYIMYITFISAFLHLTLSLIFTKYSLYYTAFIYVLTQLLIVLFIKKAAEKVIKENLQV